MQNIQGQTYRVLLAQRQGKGFSELEVTEILRQVLPQLAELHNQGQAHGGISLDTLLQKDGQVVLTPTPASQTPNQSSISKDIYALGVIMIVLLTAKAPKSLRNPDGSWNWQNYCLVSDQLIEIINRMVAYQPGNRFTTADEVLLALNLFAPPQLILPIPHINQNVSDSTVVSSVISPQIKQKFAGWQLGLISAGFTILVGLASWGLWNLIVPKSTLISGIFSNQSTKLFPISKNDKIGYIDNKGKIVISPQFDIIPGYIASAKFSEGLAPAVVGGKFGYIDKNGKFVINPQFDSCTEFREELALVTIGDKDGYIDQAGKIIINLNLEETWVFSDTGFSEGLAVIKICDKWGYIDKTGKIVINPQFNSASNFSEGLAAVRVGEKKGIH